MSGVEVQRPAPASRVRARWGFGPALLVIVTGGVVIRLVYTLTEAPWPPPALDDQFYLAAGGAPWKVWE